jgi:hypothetical protein
MATAVAPRTQLSAWLKVALNALAGEEAQAIPDVVKGRVSEPPNSCPK